MEKIEQRPEETDAEYVTRLMEAAVELKGEDYVYDQKDPGGMCYYIRDGQPSCIVGHVLVMAGVEPERIGLKEYLGAWRAVPELTDWDPDIVKALSDAQAAQDHGAPWGEALERYKRFLGVPVT